MSTQLQEMLLADVAQPAIWLALTILLYLGALGDRRSNGGNPLLNPTLISAAAMARALVLTDPSADHASDLRIIDFLHGLARAALTVPFGQPLPF